MAMLCAAMPCSPFLIFLLGRMNLTALAPLPLLELTIADILAYLACSSCFCCDVSLLCRYFMWYYHVPFQYRMMNIIYIIIYIYSIYIQYYMILYVCLQNGSVPLGLSGRYSFFSDESSMEFSPGIIETSKYFWSRTTFAPHKLSCEQL